MKRLVLLLCLFFLAPQVAHAAITRGVGPAIGTAVPATTCVMTLNGTTAGRMLVIALVWYEGGGPYTPSSITISGESNATAIAGSKYLNISGLDTSGEFFYLAELTGGGTKTVTVNMPDATYMGCGVMEYAGADTTSQPDGSHNDNGFDPDEGDACVTNHTTATANALIVAICDNNGAQPLAGSGYTLWGTFPDTSLVQEVQDKVDAGAAGSKSVAFAGVYNTWAMSVASFKAAGGGAPPASGVFHRRIMKIIPRHDD